MTITGRCYCGDIQYAIDGDPLLRAECHCRECQYIAGGAPGFILGVPDQGFSYTKGQASQFKRDDLENGVTREFCPRCGTHLLTRPPKSSGMGMVMIKVGTLDDPEIFGHPQMVLYTSEMQDFHILPEGVPAFEKFPS